MQEDSQAQILDQAANYSQMDNRTMTDGQVNIEQRSLDENTDKFIEDYRNGGEPQNMFENIYDSQMNSDLKNR
jgi:hypothetical protein